MEMWLGLIFIEFFSLFNIPFAEFEIFKYFFEFRKMCATHTFLWGALHVGAKKAILLEICGLGRFLCWGLRIGGGGIHGGIPQELGDRVTTRGSYRKCWRKIPILIILCLQHRYI